MESALSTFSSAICWVNDKLFSQLSNKVIHSSSDALNPKFRIMKKILLLLAVAASMGIVAPTSAEAWDGCHPQRRIVSYLPCGRPVYSVYQVYGRDRWGQPVGRWVNEHAACGCNTCRPRIVHRPVHRPVCPPPVYHAPVPSRGVSWFFSFGR